jgi:pyruvate-formate lyase-activating enzyme
LPPAPATWKEEIERLRAAADQAISNLRGMKALNDDPHIEEIIDVTADLLGRCVSSNGGEPTITPLEETRERLAAYAHEAWSSYMSYFLDKCRRPNGAYLVEPAYAEALLRQIAMPYADLSEQEKDADRAEADKMLRIISPNGGEHEMAPYFVLDLRHDPHARIALSAYIQSCGGEYPQLALDLHHWLDGIRQSLEETQPQTPEQAAAWDEERRLQKIAGLR